MGPDQERDLVKAFLQEMGPGPHPGRRALVVYLALAQSRPLLFVGLRSDAWEEVHALLLRKGVTID